MPSDSKSVTSGKLTRLDSWALNIFCLSTLFIVVFSVQAINSWSTAKVWASILTASMLPAGMVILMHAPAWYNAKKIPKEILWVLLIFICGLISSFEADNQWHTLKSMSLFVLSGPVIFLVTLYLFESTRNQTVFLWLASLGMLGLGFFGVYENNFNNPQDGYRGILLFTQNPLPAGALLILLTVSPMILLSRERSRGLKTLLSLCLMFSVVLIILLEKKGPILGLVVAMLVLFLLNNPKYFKLFLGLAFVVGFLIQFSIPTLIKYKTVFEDQFSVSVRLENYFFGLHVFKENPVLGIGFKADVAQYFDDYNLRFNHNIPVYNYKRSILSNQAYENIILTFMVELGGLFSTVYFGGIIYMLAVSFKKLRAPPQKKLVSVLIISVLVGFIVTSLTFDTLKYPQLNWLFHSILGLLMNISKKTQRN
jgi:O-antigen ligase